MNIHLRSTVILLAALAGTGSFCTHDGPVAGIEVTNGDCTGTIYQQDSTVAAGAVVRLIPAKYDPSDPSTGTVDSTTTDKAGRYAFDVAKADVYNILAEKDGTSSISESVALQPAAAAVVNDTLREPGKLAGRVSVKPEDDARNVVILVRGTNMYTAPTDSAGNFATRPLPAGTFTIQMLYAGSDEYARFDTVVTILTGKTTGLFVTLPSADAPPITGFSAIYDSATMFVSLRWAMPDTSKIISYYLYRHSKNGNDTVRIIDKSSTDYAEDLIRYQDDSVQYRISAIGTNFREGYRAATEAFVAGGKVRCVNRIDLTSIAPSSDYISSIYSDSGEDVFAVFDQSIKKLSPQGSVLKEYRPEETPVRTYFSGNLQSDDSGYLYIGCKRDNSSIIKFDVDLNVRAEYPFEPPVDSGIIGEGQYMITGNGSLYHITICTEPLSYNYQSIIRLFAPGFTEITAQSVKGRRVYSPERFGDTIVAFEFDQRPVGDLVYSGQNIVFYDAAFNQRSSFQPTTFNDKYWPPSSLFSDIELSAGPDGIVIYQKRITWEDVQLIISNTRGEILARVLISAHRQIFFDNSGNFYCFNFAGDLDLFLLKTLFKYSMASILSKNGQ